MTVQGKSGSVKWDPTQHSVRENRAELGKTRHAICTLYDKNTRSDTAGNQATKSLRMKLHTIGQYLSSQILKVDKFQEIFVVCVPFRRNEKGFNEITGPSKTIIGNILSANMENSLSVKDVYLSGMKQISEALNKSASLSGEEVQDLHETAKALKRALHLVDPSSGSGKIAKVVSQRGSFINAKDGGEEAKGSDPLDSASVEKKDKKLANTIEGRLPAEREDKSSQMKAIRSLVTQKLPLEVFYPSFKKILRQEMPLNKEVAHAASVIFQVAFESKSVASDLTKILQDQKDMLTSRQAT
ncbi:hypothetical protein COB21_06105 [Candidatus Aerophobetes bacterium]|uniref:Uncharacterized protein n=1 Tax=Aerophobetes bacterium TaxID=2030807 RepID=A0A2A4WX73_UNCAE|nr:MAG: hypothetical protein COB21_06105 [Candidatus Aerophobetes bacterium]